MQREDAVQEIARAAVAVERACGLPAEITAGMCALESGWLEHAPGNNPFGIKYSARRHSAKQLLVTREWMLPEDLEPWLRQRPGRQVLAEEGGPDERGRRLYRVRDYFAAYDSLAAALDDFARLLASPRYAPAVAAYQQHRDVRRAIRDIAAAGYTTTQPDEYADRVVAVLDGDLRSAVDAARAETIGVGDVVAT